MIKTTTINVDGKQATCKWDTLEDLEEDWFGDDWNGPSLDDALVSAEVDGFPVTGGSFEDVMKFLDRHYDFKY